jgi:hypothetical protein
VRISPQAVHDWEYLKWESWFAMKARTNWTFLSNHSHVLIALAQDPNMRIRDLADIVGITERAVAQILVDLETARVLKKKRIGRRNQYLPDPNAPLRHAVESHRTVADLLRLAGQPPAIAAKKRRTTSSIRVEELPQ